MIGTLEYLGWQRPWTLTAEDGSTRDISADFWDAAERLKGKPTSMDARGDSIALRADPASEYELIFETRGEGILISKMPSFRWGFSNVLYYFEQHMHNLNSRRIEVEIAEDRFALIARDAEDTPAVYYSDGNLAAIPEGWERSICRVGEGKNTCIFFTAGAGGFSCAKFSGPMGRMLLERHAAGQMNAGRIGNCRIAGRKDSGDG
ncbi:hypothetical protein [Mesorhizobium sp. M2A.F.Ca.ET.039.01.1.1]|uniref:hypothetical protein n=1 Tax=Mesorhizobium sp. M2A.F.Ca.ET.039.01.1.1 TaxID=2496746 RepID=UPI000FCC79B1|nr:hypothetical protein [Mesorhizobium sp. M2A.F.Ca.ET.039.01.1.1]RWX72520.1 hypothetical protein EOA24_00575 [Mesorhizobium sp. M2A.F.Ca.ET.039.01.1.1]